MGSDNVMYTILLDTWIDETVGATSPGVMAKPPGPVVPLVTGSDMTRVISLGDTACTCSKSGLMPSSVVTFEFFRWFAGIATSVIPPALGIV